MDDSKDSIGCMRITEDMERDVRNIRRNMERWGLGVVQTRRNLVIREITYCKSEAITLLGYLVWFTHIVG